MKNHPVLYATTLSKIYKKMCHKQQLVLSPTGISHQFVYILHTSRQRFKKNCKVNGLNKMKLFLLSVFVFHLSVSQKNVKCERALRLKLLHLNIRMKRIANEGANNGHSLLFFITELEPSFASPCVVS